MNSMDDFKMMSFNVEGFSPLKAEFYLISSPTSYVYKKHTGVTSPGLQYPACT